VNYNFQINLRGIIDLLSHHLYSGPQVFIRELLQNGIDAIQARTYIEPGFRGEVALELVEPRGPRTGTLIFTDNGIGLTEDEIHRFLATIGQTSKRADQWDRPTDFLGQFGIGLLSCFVVSDEIVVITRSARDRGPTIEWRGRPDGTYTINKLSHDIEPGTQVYLTGRKDCAEYFQTERIEELVRHFGGLLPFPIKLTVGHAARVINKEPPPWRQHFDSAEAEREALLDFGRATFETTFFDVIPLKTRAGDVDGVAYVLPYSPSPATKRTHRVYLKNMLLSESAENLLPEWAFFVKCIVNVNKLRPTASREAFYEDDTLAQTRAELGECLRDYLVRLAKKDPVRLRRLIGLHYLSIKALAIHDDEFYRLFIDWLPFETSMGEMTLGEYRKQYPVVRYIPSLDQFRQMAPVAAAQSICVINGAYTYDAELLEKFSDVFPETSVEMVDSAALTQSFVDLTLEEQEQTFELIRVADVVLQPFKCSTDIKKFLPEELPTLYSTGTDAGFLRSLEQSRDIADPLWGSVLDNLADKPGGQSHAELCFNFNNPLVRKLTQLKERKMLQRSVQMLYIQALLLGHHPLSAREMRLLNEGLLAMVEWGIDQKK